MTVIEALQRVPLLKDFSASGLETLADIARERTLPAGTVLFEEDQPGDSLFLVCQGSLRLLQRDGGAGPPGRGEPRSAPRSRRPSGLADRPPMLQRLVDLLGERSLHVGYAFVFGVLLLCGFGLPMPEDVVLVTGGVLAWLASPLETPALRAMPFDPGLQRMVLVGLLGILAGDSVIYWLGRRLGYRIAEFRLLRRLVPPDKLQEVEKRLRRRGKVVVVIARYLPGLRAPTYFTVGHSRLPYWQFLVFDGLAALISAPLWVCLGFWFGDDIERAAREAGRFSNYILIGLAVVLAGLGFRWWQRRRAERAERAEREIEAEGPEAPER